MKSLMIFASVFAAAAAQTLPGQVNPPLVAPPAAPQVQVPGMPTGASAAEGAAVSGQTSVPGIVDKSPSPAAIVDGRTLDPGSASVNASARVPSSVGLAAGMDIRDMGGQSLGKIVSVTKTRAGQVASLMIQTADGVRRTMVAPSMLTVKGGAAMTTQSEADLVALPQVR